MTNTELIATLRHALANENALRVDVFEAYVEELCIRLEIADDTVDHYTKQRRECTESSGR